MHKPKLSPMPTGNYAFQSSLQSFWADSYGSMPQNRAIENDSRLTIQKPGALPRPETLGLSTSLLG
jgi:hypothetical protein